jgi:hypothetical protein
LLNTDYEYPQDIEPYRTNRVHHPGSWNVVNMKSILFCLLGAAAGTFGLMAFDTAALSRSETAPRAPAGSVDVQAAAHNVITMSDGRKVRVVYPSR